MTRLVFAIAAVSVCALWGGNLVAGRVALADLPPLHLAAGRAVLATIGVLAWGVARKRSFAIPLVDALPMAGLGLLTTGVFWLLNLALEVAPASQVAILIYLYPLFTAVISHACRRGERLTRRAMLSLLLGFAGATITVGISWSSGRQGQLLGALLATTSAVFWALYTIVAKRLLVTSGTVAVVFYPTALSAVLCLALAGMMEGGLRDGPSPMALVAVFYQGVVAGAVANIVWLRLLREESAARLSFYALFTPALGVIAGSVLLGESMSLQLLVGLVLVVSATYARDFTASGNGAQSRKEPPERGGIRDGSRAVVSEGRV